MLPGLDPTAPYYSRLSARSALYTELRLLLAGRRHPLAGAGYRSLAVEENRLGRSSKAAREKLWSELRSRYRLDAADPLFAAFLKEWQRSDSDQEQSLTAYVLLALNDRLVTDLGIDWLYPLLRGAPAELQVKDILSFIQRSERDHPEVSGWSRETTVAVAQKYSASLRDFGLAKGTVKKTTIRPALYGSPVRLLLRALGLAGTSQLEIVRSPIFRLLGIDSNEVVDALGELNRLGAVRFRMQGDVVELDLLEAA